MAGTKKTIAEWFHGPPQASNLVPLPIRRKPVGEPPSINNQNAQSEVYLSARTPGKGATPDLDIKVKSKDKASKTEQKDAKVKPSVFTRATRTIKSCRQAHLSISSTKLSPESFAQEPSMNAASSGPAGPGQSNRHGIPQATIVDLTSDSDDDDDVNNNDINALPNRARAASSEQPPDNLSWMNNFIAPQEQQERIFGQENLPGGFGLPALGEALQDHMFHDDEAYARALQQQYAFELPVQDQGSQIPGHSTVGAEMAPPNVLLDPLVQCMQTLEAVFPGICTDHVSELFDTVSKSSEELIDHILSKGPYPRVKDKQIALKRKRELDPDEEAARKYSAADRVIPGKNSRIWSTILFSAYKTLYEAVRTNTPEKPTFQSIVKARKTGADFTEEAVEAFLAQATQDEEKIEVLKELQTARRIRRRTEAHYQAELDAQRLEEENTRQAEADGLMGVCGCCCDDYPLNRLVHCNGEVPHEFCRNCARRNAETEVGKSKFELNCMSVDACTGGFDRDQRSQFLDESTRIALDRNEQEAALRLAGIENLESCPFCPFAAEYPPVEIDREFRCQAPDCEKISCRLCKEESHIPKTCQEYMKEKGLSVRRDMEEAMSAAIIRKCNKCGTPFVKEEGCNKMTCTRNGCGNVQCYACSKSCDYKHFNDPSRGGKAGNCPLFEGVEERHEREVREAEQEALKKIMAEHPEYTEEDLKIEMSENVKKDDERRKATYGGRVVPAVFPEMQDMAMRIQARREGLQAPQRIARRLNIRPALFRRADPVLPPALHYDPAAPLQHQDPIDELMNQFMDFDEAPIHPLDEPLDPPLRQIDPMDHHHPGWRAMFDVEAARLSREIMLGAEFDPQRQIRRPHPLGLGEPQFEAPAPLRAYAADNFNSLPLDVNEHLMPPLDPAPRQDLDVGRRLGMNALPPDYGFGNLDAIDPALLIGQEGIAPAVRAPAVVPGNQQDPAHDGAPKTPPNHRNSLRRLRDLELQALIDQNHWGRPQGRQRFGLPRQALDGDMQMQRCPAPKPLRPGHSGMNEKLSAKMEQVFGVRNKRVLKFDPNVYRSQPQNPALPNNIAGAKAPPTLDEPQEFHLGFGNNMAPIAPATPGPGLRSRLEAAANNIRSRALEPAGHIDPSRQPRRDLNGFVRDAWFHGPENQEAVQKEVATDQAERNLLARSDARRNVAEARQEHFRQALLAQQEGLRRDPLVGIALREEHRKQREQAAVESNRRPAGNNKIWDARRDELQDMAMARLMSQARLERDAQVQRNSVAPQGNGGPGAHFLQNFNQMANRNASAPNMLPSVARLPDPILNAPIPAPFAPPVRKVDNEVPPENFDTSGDDDTIYTDSENEEEDL